MTSVLYISYDGILEPLGESQVVGYLEKLTNYYDIHLISFEKPDDQKDLSRLDAMKKRAEIAGIAWTPLSYHKAPSAPATAYDISVGTAVALSTAIAHRIDIVHARSYMAALMGLAVKRAAGAKFLFDMRGFWADERVDAGIWPIKSRFYRIAKSLERRLLREADHVVTLTRASAREINQFPYLQHRAPRVTIIPTCVDLNRFSPGKLNTLSADFTLGYAGAVGLGHSLDEALTFFKAIRKRRAHARLLIVNRNEHSTINALLGLNGIEADHVDIAKSEYRHMPAHLQKMTAGVAIYKPNYSAIARAPTRVAEYLGCGIPCVGNLNVGDIEETLEGRRVGIVIREFSPAGHAEAADRLLALLDNPRTRERCVSTARELFSLDSGVEAYRAIYERLAVERAGCRTKSK